MNELTYRELSKSLGYNSLGDMYQAHGYKRANISRIKRDNPDRYESIKREIIMSHYNIDTLELLHIIEQHERRGNENQGGVMCGD